MASTLCACSGTGQPLGNLGTIADSVFNLPASPAPLSEAEVASGLQQALTKGTQIALQELGRRDGFWGNPRFRIPLPPSVVKADSLLRIAGLGPRLDQLHLSLNRAAEQAVPIAADSFAQAVRQLTVRDAYAILNGADDAATQYFRRTTHSTLTQRFKPIVADVTRQSGLAQQYKKMLDNAGPASRLLGNAVDLDVYVTQKTLDSLYLRIADEERAIRTQPAARTSELLRRVFGQ